MRGPDASADSSAEPGPGGWPGVMPRSLVWELAAPAPPSQQQPPVCEAPCLPPPGGKCSYGVTGQAVHACPLT